MRTSDHNPDQSKDRLGLDDIRLSRRRSFDDVAAAYDRARPPYPEALVEDLVKLVQLGPHSRVLEIGCGTGQLTVALARRGASILVVELGPNLAALAIQRVAQFARATVVVADFDRWNAPGGNFDVVVCANVFHWLNPETRLSKCIGALRPGGTLAIVETHWTLGSCADRFFTATQECYARWDAHHHPSFKPNPPESLPSSNDELGNSSEFQEVRLQQLVHERRYSAAEYCDLLSTFSDIRAWDEKARSGFLECIRPLIDSRFNGSVARKDVYRVWLARTRGAGR